MPELPDVETMRLRLDSHGLNRRIAGVDVPDPEALDDASAEDLRDAVADRRFTEATRHGKVLFVHAAGGPWLAMHFGMTGDLAVLDEDEDIPEHARVVFDFRDGGRLAFDNPRKFGWLDLTDD